MSVPFAVLVFTDVFAPVGKRIAGIVKLGLV